jgi:hypothetical protein
LYGISTNLKKCMFLVSEINILGHAISKEGIYIDPENIKAINYLIPPTSNKGVQSFFGNIKLVRRFVPNYAGIVNPINMLLKKEQKFEWNP